MNKEIQRLDTPAPETEEGWKEEVRTGAPWTQDGKTMLAKIQSLLTAQKEKIKAVVKEMRQRKLEWGGTTDEEKNLLLLQYDAVNRALSALLSKLDQV